MLVNEKKKNYEEDDEGSYIIIRNLARFQKTYVMEKNEKFRKQKCSSRKKQTIENSGRK